ncbi:MAG: restriction endonuclease [Ferruginibacter sp.]
MKVNNLLLLFLTKVATFSSNSYWNRKTYLAFKDIPAPLCILEKMYKHLEYTDGRNISDNPFRNRCPYCNSILVITEIEDCWDISNEEIIDAHSQTIQVYKEIHDLEDCYLELELPSEDIDVEVYYCWACGWWRLIKNICISAREWQIWDIKFGCAAILKKLDEPDINEPLSEVRDFLSRSFEQRFNINPKLFQDVVADVFKSLGYFTQARSFTNDGGIDIVLTNASNQQIGVQVKRSKNTIVLEQIRAFVGALLLGNMTAGIYVTTSSFTTGSKKVIQQSANVGMPIALLDASSFYDALKIAQIKDRFKQQVPFEMNALTIPRINYYGWDTPKNSL